jgi:hypothetical protein
MEGATLDQFYNLTAGMRDDYVNPTADGAVSWRSLFSYDSDSQEALPDWQECNHEMKSRFSAMIKSVRWIGADKKDPPTFDGTGDVEDFIEDISIIVTLEQLVPTLDVTPLKSTPSRWWATHQEDLGSWE